MSEASVAAADPMLALLAAGRSADAGALALPGVSGDGGGARGRSDFNRLFMRVSGQVADSPEQGALVQPLLHSAEPRAAGFASAGQPVESLRGLVQRLEQLLSEAAADPAVAGALQGIEQRLASGGSDAGALQALLRLSAGTGSAATSGQPANAALAGAFAPASAGLARAGNPAADTGDPAARDLSVPRLEQLLERLRMAVAAAGAGRPGAAPAPHAGMPLPDDGSAQRASDGNSPAAESSRFVDSGRTATSFQDRPLDSLLDRLRQASSLDAQGRTPVHRAPTLEARAAEAPAPWSGTVAASQAAAAAPPATGGEWSAAPMPAGGAASAYAQGATPLQAYPAQAQAATGQTFEQVVSMVREGRSSARIQLNPPELGRVDIRLEMDGPEARVQLVTQNAQVREGLEAMLPRLREMLSEQGLQLADASVSDQRAGGEADDDTAGRPRAGAAAADGLEGEDGAAELADAAARPLRLDGLLDAYA